MCKVGGAVKTIITILTYMCQECEEAGEDYDRVKLLELSAVDAEKWAHKKKKKNPDTGFSGIVMFIYTILYVHIWV